MESLGLPPRILQLKLHGAKLPLGQSKGQSHLTKTLKSNFKSLANFPEELSKKNSVTKHSEASWSPLFHLTFHSTDIIAATPMSSDLQPKVRPRDWQHWRHLEAGLKTHIFRSYSRLMESESVCSQDHKVVSMHIMFWKTLLLSTGSHTLVHIEIPWKYYYSADTMAALSVSELLGQTFGYHHDLIP